MSHTRQRPSYEAETHQLWCWLQSMDVMPSVCALMVRAGFCWRRSHSLIVSSYEPLRSSAEVGEKQHVNT